MKVHGVHRAEQVRHRFLLLLLLLLRCHESNRKTSFQHLQHFVKAHFGKVKTYVKVVLTTKDGPIPLSGISVEHSTQSNKIHASCICMNVSFVKSEYLLKNVVQITSVENPRKSK